MRALSSNGVSQVNSVRVVDWCRFVAVTKIVGGDVDGDFSDMLRLRVESVGCGSVSFGCGEDSAIFRMDAAKELLLLQKKKIRTTVEIVAVTMLRMLTRSSQRLCTGPLLSV